MGAALSSATGSSWSPSTLAACLDPYLRSPDTDEDQRRYREAQIRAHRLIRR
jgi:hypothetical protein